MSVPRWSSNCFFCQKEYTSLGTEDTGEQLVAESEPYTKVTNGTLLPTDMYVYIDRSQTTRRKGITGHAEAW